MNITELKRSIETLEKCGLIESESRDKQYVAFAPAYGQKIIVRSRDAGVLFGIYDGNSGDTVKMRDAVQMWRWKAAKGGTLIDCATYGVDPSGCRFSVANATVTVFNACAIIECSDAAIASISSVKGGDWK